MQSILSYNKEKYDETQKLLDKAIDKDKDNSNYFLNQAKALWKLNLNIEAINSIDRFISINTNNSYAYYVKGIICDSDKNFDEAISNKQEAIRLDSQNHVYYNSIGISYFNKIKSCYNKEELERDRSYVKMAIDYDGSESLYYKNLGVIYDKIADNEKDDKTKIDLIEKGQKALTKAIEIKFDNADYYYNRSGINHKLGHYKEALKDAFKAVYYARLKKNYKEYFYNLVNDYSNSDQELKKYAQKLQYEIDLWC